MLMILPGCLAARSRRPNAREHRNGPVRFVCNAVSHSPRDKSIMGFPSASIPALLTRMVAVPNAFSAARNNSATAASSPTSARASSTMPDSARSRLWSLTPRPRDRGNLRRRAYRSARTRSRGRVPLPHRSPGRASPSSLVRSWPNYGWRTRGRDAGSDAENFDR